MVLITGMEIGVFQRMEAGGYSLLFPLNFAGKNFYTDITAFIRFYKTLLLLGVTTQVYKLINTQCITIYNMTYFEYLCTNLLEN